MGCCGSGRPGTGNDKLTELERKLGLHSIPIHHFQAILHKAAGDREITLEEFGNAFKTYSFGKEATKQTANLNKILSHSIFKARGGDLDWLHVFTLGLLYANGTIAEKIDALLQTYDSNGDGIIFTQTVKKIVTDVATVAAVIVPALYHNLDFENAEQKTEEAMDTFIGDSMFKIFKSELKVDRDRLKSALSHEAKYLLDSAFLRR